MSTPPALIDDAVTEILLRIPPGDPALLVRCSLVCKHWRLLLSDPAFPRRHRAFHRVPPILGFLDTRYGEDGHHTAIFVPATAFRPLRPDLRDWSIADSHHGRVLFYEAPYSQVDWGLNQNSPVIVWDPITDHQWTVPMSKCLNDICSWSAAVLCATDGCDHLHCHDGPFYVVVVSNDDEDLTYTSVYSSVTDDWIDTIPVELPADMNFNPGVVVGNKIYFDGSCEQGYIIAEYDMDKHNMGKRELSVVNPPFPYLDGIYQYVLVTLENGELGFATVLHSKLYAWSRKAGPNGVAAWVESRVIELETVLPIRGLPRAATVVGFAEGVGVIFISTHDGVFTVDIKSGHARKVFTGDRETSLHELLHSR